MWVDPVKHQLCHRLILFEVAQSPKVDYVYVKPCMCVVSGTRCLATYVHYYSTHTCWDIIDRYSVYIIV